MLQFIMCWQIQNPEASLEWTFFEAVTKALLDQTINWKTKYGHSNMLAHNIGHSIHASK